VTDHDVSIPLKTFEVSISLPRADVDLTRNINGSSPTENVETELTSPVPSRVGITRGERLVDGFAVSASDSMNDQSGGRASWNSQRTDQQGGQ
jgi:hypothetical protein